MTTLNVTFDPFLRTLTTNKMPSWTSPQWLRILSTMLAQKYKICRLKLSKWTKQLLNTDITAFSAFQGRWKRIFSPKANLAKRLARPARPEIKMPHMRRSVSQSLLNRGLGTKRKPGEVAVTTVCNLGHEQVHGKQNFRDLWDGKKKPLITPPRNVQPVSNSVFQSSRKPYSGKRPGWLSYLGLMYKIYFFSAA